MTSARVSACTVSPAKPPLLEVRGLGKSFPGVRALDSVNFAASAGGILGLVGENGAGKSTLIKILAGVYANYDGTVALAGEPVAFASPREAQEAGIATIFQELTLVPELTVAENVFLGREILRAGRLGLVDRAAMRAATTQAASELGVALDPDQPVGELSIAARQLVEICKALVTDARVVVMDEPTSSLSQREVEKLHDIARRLREKGRLVLYVSHKLDEIFAICDDILVMRDGRLVLHARTGDLTADAVVTAMVGRSLEQVFPARDAHPGEPLLVVDGLARRGEFAPLSLEIRDGEIVGLAGLVGAGRTALARAVVGATLADEGSVRRPGRPARRYTHPREALADGIVYLSEDRKGDGLMLDHTVRENVALSVLSRLTRRGLIARARERALAQEKIEDLRIKTDGPEATASSLSGGNQQKVAIGRLLATDADVFILDEPTRGVDVGAKAEIYRIVRGLAEAGRGVLLISSELPEVLGLSDRILVMSEGRILSESPRAQACPERVMGALTGRPAA